MHQRPSWAGELGSMNSSRDKQLSHDIWQKSLLMNSCSTAGRGDSVLGTQAGGSSRHRRESCAVHPGSCVSRVSCWRAILRAQDLWCHRHLLVARMPGCLSEEPPHWFPWWLDWHSYQQCTRALWACIFANDCGCLCSWWWPFWLGWGRISV
jgi:hypothetical protein